MVIDCTEVAERFEWLLDEVEIRGVCFDVYKDGKPFIRIVPVSAEDLLSDGSFVEES